MEKVGRILNTGRSIYIGGMGNIKEAKIKETREYVFSGLGVFNGNGRSLQFAVIANENRFCYDAYSGDEEPCPRDPFPIKNAK